MPTLTTHALLLAAAAESPHSATSVILAILGVGFLIFVHELGHFLACRVTRTRVEAFSIGFGPRLFGWETEGGVRRFTVGERRSLPSGGALDVRIAAIPLGGYVKMAGEIGGDGTATSGAGAAPRAPAPDEYPSKSFGARTLIISAGVIMNALFAFLFFWIAYASGLREIPPVVGGVTPGGAAWTAGLEPGDRVLRIDGRTVRTFLDVQQGIALAAGGTPSTFEVERDGRTLSLAVSPVYDEEIGLQQAQLRPLATLGVDDGSGERVEIGARERVVVSGRSVRGGYEAYGAIADAIGTARESVELELPSRSPPVSKTISLARARKAPTKPDAWRLGIVLFDRRVVKAVRDGGPAARSGLRVDDLIVAADGEAIASPADLAFRPRILSLEVLRGGAKTALEVRAERADDVARFLAGVAFATKAPPGPLHVHPSGAELDGGRSPAAEAGVRAGDVLVAIDGAPIATTDDVLAKVKTFDGKPVRLTVRTGDDAPRELTVAPRAVRDAAEHDAFLAPDLPKELVDVGGVGGAAAAAFDRTKTEIGNIFRLIGQFFGGGVSFQKNISGPLTIANLSSRSASGGLASFLSFLAFISVNLCVLNFLPIPVLDGGQMLFLLIEKARGGRRLSDAAVGRFQLVGLVLLLLLMAFALKNDVTHLFGS